MAFSQKAWYDDCYISVCALAGSEVQLCSKTTSLSVSGGNFDIEGINTFCGKVTRVGSKEDIEISFDGIPVSNQDFDWIFHGASNTATSITTSSTVKYRVSMLWTNQTGVTAATQAITGSNEAYRRIYADAYCTGVEYNMDAGENLKATLTFKLPTEDSDGLQNYKMESKDTTSGTLSATPSYAGSTKF
jgi:hypothetical protein